MIATAIIIITVTFLAYIINEFSKYKILLDEIEREDRLTNP